MVKCHSNMSCSRGAAWYWSEGSMDSSRMSAWIRRREGDLDMVFAVLDVCTLVDMAENREAIRRMSPLSGASSAVGFS